MNKDLSVLKIQHEETTKQLKIARIVAIIVFVCFCVQIYHNFEVKAYMSSLNVPGQDEFANSISGTSKSVKGIVTQAKEKV